MSSMQCYRCNETGHMARDCPNSGGGGGGGGGRGKLGIFRKFSNPKF